MKHPRPWISSAGIDVYEKEPPNPENPFFKLENIVLTPYIAWYTDEALDRLRASAIEEAIRLLRGVAKNLANKEILKL